MSSHKSDLKTNRFIAAEYVGRKVAVRRSPNYDTTLSLVKEAFKPLGSVDSERISISAFVEELGSTLEISKNIWSDLLPDLKHITITLDSSSPEPDDLYHNVENAEDESSEDESSNEGDSEVGRPETAGSEDGCSSGDEIPEATPTRHGVRKPSSRHHRRLVQPLPSTWSKPVAVPPSLSDQGYRGNRENRTTIKVFYFHKNRDNWISTEIMAVPTTTIRDLQEYIARLCQFKGYIVSYQLFGKPLDDLDYVQDMQDSEGPKRIMVHMVDRDPGPCRMSRNGGVCRVCNGNTVVKDR
ncbi:ubiquitin-like Rad60 SUMO-like protein [Ceratobasidium sp. AG-Ba]|nr:ubiquitin-like Rad60 SUMO-like protein [Ceratobasidium sp. AG-Ba]